MITWNPNDKDDKIILKNDFTCEKKYGQYGGIRANKGAINGKYYWEILLNTISTDSYSDIVVGVCSKDQVIEGFSSCGGFSELRGLYESGHKVSYGKLIKYSKPYKENDIVGILLDMGNKSIEFSINGERQGVAYSDLKDIEYYPCVFAWTNFSWTVNFGAKPFKYKIPEGYKPFDYKNANWLCKFLIKQANGYYALKSNFYYIGQPKSNTELESWYEKYGVDEPNVLLEPINKEQINISLDEATQIWSTDKPIDFNRIKDTIELIEEGNNKSIQYGINPYRIYDKLNSDAILTMATDKEDN